MKKHIFLALFLIISAQFSAFTMQHPSTGSVSTSQATQVGANLAVTAETPASASEPAPRRILIGSLFAKETAAEKEARLKEAQEEANAQARIKQAREAWLKEAAGVKRKAEVTISAANAVGGDVSVTTPELIASIHERIRIKEEAAQLRATLSKGTCIKKADGSASLDCLLREWMDGNIEMEQLLSSFSLPEQKYIRQRAEAISRTETELARLETREINDKKYVAEGIDQLLKLCHRNLEPKDASAQPVLNEYRRMHDQLRAMTDVSNHCKVLLIRALREEYFSITIGDKITPDKVRLVDCYKALFADEAIFRVVINAFGSFNVFTPSCGCERPHSFTYSEFILTFARCTDAQLDEITQRLNINPQYFELLTCLQYTPAGNNVLVHALYEARRIPLLPLNIKQKSRVATFTNWLPRGVTINESGIREPHRVPEPDAKLLQQLQQQYYFLTRFHLYHDGVALTCHKKISGMVAPDLEPYFDKHAQDFGSNAQERRNHLRNEIMALNYEGGRALLPPLIDVVTEYYAPWAAPLALT